MPSNEAHLKRYIARTGYHMRAGLLTYQYEKYKAVLEYVKGFRHALDIGGFIGQWSHVMAQDFAHITAFEPVPLYRHCWFLNNQENDNAHCYPCALGRERKLCTYENRTKYSHGDTVMTDGGKDVVMWTLDEMNLADVDFIKIDCEGGELDILRGGHNLIARDRPVIIVEQKDKYYDPGMVKPSDWLEVEHGYKCERIIKGDAIMVP